MSLALLLTYICYYAGRRGWGGVSEMDLIAEEDLIALGVKPGHAKLIVVRWKKYRNGEASSFTHKHRGVPK